MIRTRVAMAAAIMIAMVAVPMGASAQSADDEFPLYGEDKFLGSGTGSFTLNQEDPSFLDLFNQVTPENAGKWGSVAGSSREDERRWGQLDTIYEFSQTNDIPMRFHVLAWGNQQPGWMADLPPDEQLEELEAWMAAVAERYPDLEWVEVVNEATWDPPDCNDPKNAGDLCNSAGNYLEALGGYNGTDGTGWDWILNAFRMAREYFPDTKLMINDVLITNDDEATSTYLDIIEVLQAEDLVDGIGVQGHVHVTTEGVPGPTVWRRDWAPEEDMSVHEANLDRLAATGLPIQVTELELDGADRDGVPGDEVQLADYRRVFPTFWEHPGVEGVTLWGWRAPFHWRNDQNAPIVRSDGSLKPAGHWLFNYVNGIAPVVRPDQTLSLGDAVGGQVGPVVADDWASDIGREDLRTFTWDVTGGSGAAAFAIEPDSGQLDVDIAELDPEAASYSLSVQVDDGFHTSDEVALTIEVPSTLLICDADGREVEVDRADLGDYAGEEGATVGACSPSRDQSVSVAVPEGEPGEFVWTIQGDGQVDLGEMSDEGSYLAASGTIDPIAVIDTRTDGPPWSISGQVSDFAPGGPTGNHLGWTPEVVDPGAGAVAGDTVASGIDGGDGLSVPATLASAEDGHELGSATLGADLDLRFPVDTAPGDYTATLTITALS